MNIETVYNILNMLKKFTELLKSDMSLDTLQSVRDIKGVEVLENYEKMFEIDAISTKNNLRNYIINEINSLSTSFMEVSNYDNGEIKTFSKDKFNVPEIDVTKLNFILEKFDDEEAFSLITHKLSILEYYNNIASDARYLELIKTDSSVKVKLEDIISKYNSILEMIGATLKDKEIITFDINGDVYGYKLDEQTSVDVKEYMTMFKNSSKEISNKISLPIKNIKDNLEEIDYKVSLSKDLRENFMKIVDEYCKGIISSDSYDYLYKKQLEIMEFYVRTIISYISSVVSYLEFISENVEALKDINSAIEISYSLFNKTE